MNLRTIKPHAGDVGGGFTVRRLWPAARRGTFTLVVFFDHFGTVTAGPDDNQDVRPHPHIELVTVPYLCEGTMMHRNSTSAVQPIEACAINR